MNKQVTSVFRNDQPHTRQYVIGPEPFKFHNDWKVLSLDNGLWLSYCPKLCVKSGINRAGTRITLIGIPIECQPEQNRPEECFTEITKENFRRNTYGWSNRWCIIIGREIITDAGSLMSVFYPKPSTWDQRKLYISSSQKLLSKFYEVSWDYSGGTPYAPMTYSPELFVLLPDQRLDIVDGTIDNPTYPYMDNLDKSEESLREQMASLLKVFMQELHNKEKAPICLSLSGGADSRRQMAAMLAAQVPIFPFTFKKNYWETSDADIFLPDRICQEVGTGLKSIEARNRSFILAKEKLYREHTGFRISTTPGEAFFYYTTGCLDELPPERPFMDGQAYELVGNYYYRETPPLKSIDDLLAWRFSTTLESRKETRLYMEHAVDNGGSFKDLRDYAFLLANMPVYGHKYQFLDMIFHVYTPVNCRLIYSIAQSVEVLRRQEKKFLISVTNHLEPRFANFPTNPRNKIAKAIWLFIKNTKISDLASHFWRKYIMRAWN